MVASGEAILERSEDLLRVYEQTGDERAFAQIVRTYRGMVFGVCLRVMRNSHDAEDATQAVFLTLAMQARGGNEIRTLGPWLQQVAHRVSLDMYKSRKRRQAREEIRRQQSHDRFDPDEGRQIDQDELREMLRLQLNELPAKYRLPMILYYFGGLTPEAIAKELGCKKKTLGVRLFRARKLLAEQLASRGVVACGAPLLLALREVMQQGLLQSLPAAGAGYASGIGASAGLGLGFDHLTGTLAAMTNALLRFGIGSKLRLTLLLMIATSTAMAGYAGLIRDIDLAYFRKLKLISGEFDLLDELLRSMPRLASPDLRVDASDIPAVAEDLPPKRFPVVPGIQRPMEPVASTGVVPILPRTGSVVVPSVSLARLSIRETSSPASLHVRTEPGYSPPPVVVRSNPRTASVSLAGVGHSYQGGAKSVERLSPELKALDSIASAGTSGEALEMFYRESNPASATTGAAGELPPGDVVASIAPPDNGEVITSGSGMVSLDSVSRAHLSAGGTTYAGLLDGTLSMTTQPGRSAVGVIPEPATLSLLVMSAGLMMRRRKTAASTKAIGTKASDEAIRPLLP